jgi:hypothetical protein
MPVADLTRLVQLTDFFWRESDEASGAEAGEEKLNAALENGALAKLLAAPPEVDAILDWSGSLDVTLAWIEVAGDQVAKVVELRLYETIDPLRITTLSLAALLAIGDNVLIHKLRVLPIDQLLTLLQLSTADLTQVAATATSAELEWLAGYLATLSSEQALAVAHELAMGKVTIATLQAPPVAASGSNESASSSNGVLNGAPGNGGSSTEADSSASPVAGMPARVVALWTPLANNGVAVAAGIVVLLLVVVGVFLALRREMTNPPL